MTLILWIVIILIAAIFSALYSGLETGVYTYDSVEKTEGSKRVTQLLKHRNNLIVACLVGTNFAVYAATLALGKILINLDLQESWGPVIEIFLLTPFLFVVSEIIPKSLFQTRANTLLPRFTWFLAISTVLFGPFIAILRFITSLMTRFSINQVAGSMMLTRERLHWVLQDHGSVLSHEQSKMLNNALKLKERRVTSLMVPCKKVARISVETPLEEVKKRFLQTDYSFFVVYNKKPENVLGIVYLNKILLSEKRTQLTDLLVEIPKISYKSTLTGSLEILRDKSVPIGRVVGVKEHTLGLVFTRQIVQEIVGELQIW